MFFNYICLKWRKVRDICAARIRNTSKSGCFGISGKNAGNKGAKKFINDIIKRLEKNRKANKGTDINIKLKKRNDVDWEWEVDEEGEKEE